jgi:hypothetical protein
MAQLAYACVLSLPWQARPACSFTCACRLRSLSMGPTHQPLSTSRTRCHVGPAVQLRSHDLNWRAILPAMWRSGGLVLPPSLISRALFKCPAARIGPPLLAIRVPPENIVAVCGGGRFARVVPPPATVVVRRNSFSKWGLGGSSSPGEAVGASNWVVRSRAKVNFSPSTSHRPGSASRHG